MLTYIHTYIHTYIGTYQSTYAAVDRRRRSRGVFLSFFLFLFCSARTCTCAGVRFRTEERKLRRAEWWRRARRLRVRECHPPPRPAQVRWNPWSHPTAHYLDTYAPVGTAGNGRAWPRPHLHTHIHTYHTHTLTHPGLAGQDGRDGMGRSAACVVPLPWRWRWWWWWLGGVRCIREARSSAAAVFLPFLPAPATVNTAHPPLRPLLLDPQPRGLHES